MPSLVTRMLLCGKRDYRTDGVFCLDFLRILTETASVQ